MLQDMKETGAPAPGGEVPSMTLGEYLAKAGTVLRMGIPSPPTSSRRFRQHRGALRAS